MVVQDFSAIKTDINGPQEIAIQANQTCRRHNLCFAFSCRSSGLPSPELSQFGFGNHTTPSFLWHLVKSPYKKKFLFLNQNICCGYLKEPS